MKSSNNSSERKPPWPFKRPPNKCGVFCIVLGILFLSNAMLSTFFRIPLSNFLGMYIVCVEFHFLKVVHNIWYNVSSTFKPRFSKQVRQTLFVHYIE